MSAGKAMPPQTVQIGPLNCRIEDGGLRWLRMGGVEVVRGIACPIRDADWGTSPHQEVADTLSQGRGYTEFNRSFTAFDGALRGAVSFRIHPHGVEAEAVLTATRPVLTNRAGFTLLHPLAGVCGTPLSITAPDGTVTQTAWPQTISPGQPARDMAALHHEVDGVRVEIGFEGEVFEMEDQRNWTDASFKTYCRPLALPFPYEIAPGKPVRQRIIIRLSGAATPRSTPAPAPPRSRPAPMLAVEPGWEGAGVPGVALLARGAVAVDAAMHEVVVPAGVDTAAHLRSLALHPLRLTVLPAPYLKSHQPDGPWPEGPTPADCARAAATVFPDAEIGLGMLTNFTELNRCPPEPGLGDYVTHGTAANVHAADDASVLETLEALPHVFTSTRTLAGDRPLRLGLVAIGSRSNPYGAALTPNPHGARLTLTQIDPRQREAFAAAFAVAAYAAAAEGGVASLALAAPSGPFGVRDSDGVWPIFHAIRALAGLTGTLEAAGAHEVATANQRIVANPALEPRGVALKAACVLTGPQPDANWLLRASRGPVDTLPPLSVAFEGDFA